MYNQFLIAGIPFFVSVWSLGVSIKLSPSVTYNNSNILQHFPLSSWYNIYSSELEVRVRLIGPIIKSHYIIHNRDI